MSKNDYLITEKPFKALLIFALPIIIGNLFQQAYNIVDSAVVGHFVSEEALAAVGACSALTFIFIGVANGGGIGASVIVSRHFGEKNMKALKTAFYTAFFSFLVLSLALAAIGLLGGRALMLFLNTPENIIDMVMVYLNIYFLGLPFLFMYNVIASMFNALGRSRIPLYFLIFSSIFNIVLDVLLVTRADLGIAGVAWATLIAQGLSALLSFLVLIRDIHKLCPERVSLFSFSEMKEMARVALPSILQQLTISVGMLFVQAVVNSFGSQVLAGFSAASRIENVCIVPMVSVCNALSSYTAQNLGAGRPERVPEGLRAALLLDGIFAVLWIVLCETCADPMASVFMDASSSAVAYGTATFYIHVIGFFFMLIGIKMAFDGILRGSGDVKMFTIANLANLALRLILSYSLGPTLGMTIIVAAVPMGWLVNGLISGWEYRTGRWRRI